MRTDRHRRKKILHITHGLGGIQTYLEYVLKYSDPVSFEHSIAGPANAPFQEFCKGLATYYPLKVKREVNPFSDIFLLIKLIRIARKVKPDILHVHSAKGGFLGRLAGLFSKAKIIYTPHGFSYLSFTGMKRIFFFMLECMTKKRSNVLLAVSQSEANRAIFEIGYSAEKVKVIPNAISTNANASGKNFESNLRIGMIGRLTIQKNPMLFMRIAQTLLIKYPKLEFKILGAGLDEHLGTALRKFIDENNLQKNIHLLPWGPAGTSRDFIYATDIYIMTSVFEGLPYSLLEAMDGECACVVSKVDGNTDIIQHGENGFACLTREEFCNSIELLINDRTLREKFGQAGRRYVNENHNILHSIGQLQKVYNQV